MKRKLRIFSHIAVIALSICMFAFGVYAASTVSVTTSGTVTFSATDVYARVTRTVTGAKNNPNNMVQEFDATIQDGADPFKMGEGESLVFTDANTPIVMTFEITNLATDRNIDFSISSTEDEDSDNVVEYYVVSANEYKDGVYNINPLATGVKNVETITITFKVIDANKSAELDYNYSINMTCQADVSTAIEESSTLRRYGNTYVLDTSLATSNSQLTKNTVTGTTSYYEYLPTINGTTISSVFHVFGTESNAITGIASQVDSLDTNLSFSTSSGVTTVSAHGWDTTFTADYYVPMAINNSGIISLVSKIGDFSYNYSITSFNLPVTTLEIGMGAFTDTGLALTCLPNWLKTIGDSAFRKCWSLALTSLPNALTSIGDSAFEYSSLQSIILPSGLTSVGKDAFAGSSLQSISLPNSLIITQPIFNGCTNLTTIIFDDNARYTSTDSKNVIIDKQTNTFIEALDTANSITIPNYITIIGESAFKGCTSLALTSLPNGVTIIGESAFEDCTSLALSSLPSGLTSIGAYAFYACKSLALTSLPSGVTSIGERAFTGCTNLALTSLPNGVISIGAYAFYECTSLRSISLPGGITSFGSQSFALCTNLKAITFEDAVARWNTINAKNKAKFTSGAVVTCSDGTVTIS